MGVFFSWKNPWKNKSLMKPEREKTYTFGKNIWLKFVIHLMIEWQQ